MNPLLWPATYRIGLYGAFVLALFFAGWYVNGMRWDAKYKGLESAYAKAATLAEEKARRETAQLQTAIEAERTTKDEHIQAITARLDIALGQLRVRPSRSTTQAPAACASSPATGAQLSREDAEFLAREAARADAISARLLYCEAAYESARRALAD
ncbi:MAG: hypothetical protein Q7J51_05385 [Sheuella sp.]|nr:hypothetical protein [Sheuella sp.]